MADPIEIPAGAQQEFISALYCKPEEATTPDRDKTLVLMVHGFPGSHKQAHRDLYGDLEFLFSSSGFHTFRFDFRCCGASEGVQEDFTLNSAAVDMDAVLGWAHKQGFEQVIYVAEGLGAAVCLPKINAQTRLAFFFWPVFDLYTYAKDAFIPHEASTGVTHTAHIRTEDGRVGVPLIEEMLAANLENRMDDLKVPVLVQYGLRDDKVGEGQIDYLRRHLKARRVDLTTYQDGNHGLTTERHRQMIFYHIGQFLSKYT